MIKDKKFGAFIVPTGIGASVGGFAGDAGAFVRKLSQYATLVVNPNTVNAGCFSAINENMLYVEGYSLDRFFKGETFLIPSKNNKIGVVFDKKISKDVLNIHINTINAVKTVYGVDIVGHEVTEEEVGVEFFVDSSGISTGTVQNIETLDGAVDKLLERGAEAIAIVCAFEDSNDPYYAAGIGVDPVGGVEAIISHYVSRKYKIPCAHSPAFEDYGIYPEIVDARAAAEYITPTFLPCILLGLQNAPRFSLTEGISVDDLDFLLMPYNALGAVPVFEALKRGIKVFAVGENKSLLDVTAQKLFDKSKIVQISTYDDVIKFL